MNKTEFLNGLKVENQQWEDLLNQIGEANMEQPGVAGHWSIKDIVAHIASWRRRTVGRLQAAARGEPEPPPPWPAHMRTSATDDEINAWFHESTRHWSVAETLKNSREIFQQMYAAIESLPDEAFNDPQKYLPWLDDGPFTAEAFFSHFHDEHEADMRAWLAQIKQE